MVVTSELLVAIRAAERFDTRVIMFMLLQITQKTKSHATIGATESMVK